MKVTVSLPNVDQTLDKTKATLSLSFIKRCSQSDGANTKRSYQMYECMMITKERREEGKKERLSF